MEIMLLTSKGHFFNKECGRKKSISGPKNSPIKTRSEYMRSAEPITVVLTGLTLNYPDKEALGTQGLNTKQQADLVYCAFLCFKMSFQMFFS